MAGTRGENGKASNDKRNIEKKEKRRTVKETVVSHGGEPEGDRNK